MYVFCHNSNIIHKLNYDVCDYFADCLNASIEYVCV